jgi:hypothetical protein
MNGRSHWTCFSNPEGNKIWKIQQPNKIHEGGGHIFSHLSVFGSVVAGAFQITFCVKMHASDIFLFFKNYF